MSWGAAAWAWCSGPGTSASTASWHSRWCCRVRRVGRICRLTDPNALLQLASSLAQVAARLEPKEASVLHPGRYHPHPGHTKTTDPNALSQLASSLAQVAARLEPREAAQICMQAATILTQAMTKTAEPNALSQLASSLLPGGSTVGTQGDGPDLHPGLCHSHPGHEQDHRARCTAPAGIESGPTGGTAEAQGRSRGLHSGRCHPDPGHCHDHRAKCPGPASIQLGPGGGAIGTQGGNAALYPGRCHPYSGHEQDVRAQLRCPSWHRVWPRWQHGWGPRRRRRQPMPSPRP